MDSDLGSPMDFTDRKTTLNDVSNLGMFIKDVSIHSQIQSTNIESQHLSTRDIMVKEKVKTWKQTNSILSLIARIHAFINRFPLFFKQSEHIAEAIICLYPHGEYVQNVRPSACRLHGAQDGCEFGPMQNQNLT